MTKMYSPTALEARHPKLRSQQGCAPLEALGGGGAGGGTSFLLLQLLVAPMSFDSWPHHHVDAASNVPLSVLQGHV